jgi:hypothetical protein
MELNGKVKAIDINPLVFALDSAQWAVLDAKIHL